MRTWLRRAGRGVVAGTFGAGLLATSISAAGASAASAAPSAAGSSTPDVCPRRVVAQQVRTDRHRYEVGQPVTITVVARNLSQHDCLPPSTVHVAVRDATGTTVFEAGTGILWIPEARWHPGQALSWTFTWDQHAAPGRYVASGSWDSYPPASTSFVIGTGR